MKFNFTRDLDAELFELGKHFKKSLLPWWDDIYVYLDRINNDFTWNTMPALVLSVYKYLGINKELTIAMTNIFKTIFFTNSIHAIVQDDEEGQKYDQDLQFNILIGDYVFGRVLKLLFEAKAVHFLEDFADMICSINEGMVMEHKLHAGYEQILLKTRAPLYELAFYTAAELADLEEEQQELFGTMGLKLGMGIELLAYSSCRDEALAYIHEGQRLFIHLNQQKNPRHTVLEKAINELHACICQLDKVAAV